MTQMNPIQNSKPKKSHPILTVVICCILSLFCGLAGGWFAITHLGNSSTVVYQNTEPESSPTIINNVANDTALSIAEVATKASPTVVEISTELTSTSYGLFGGTYTAQGAGSGVIISQDGYIITNDHVAGDADVIQVTTYDGKTYDATLVGSDAMSDIAVLKIQSDNLNAAVIGDSTKIQAGEPAIVIGNPLGTLGGTVTDGIISAASREIVINGQSMDLIQTNAEINAGNSGGGLFDIYGNLIGIVNAKDSGTTSGGSLIEGIGFAIPINTAMEVAQQLIENGGVVNRPMIGISLQELTQDTEDYKAGLYITGVLKGSSAEEKGLKAYDRVVACDETPIQTYQDLTIALRDKEIGDVIELTIERDGKKEAYEIELRGSLELQRDEEE